jgi:DNA-binding NarL/FixJ family response regulator
MRILIADERPLLRAATARLLEDEGFDVVARAADAGELVRKARAHRPDVAVIDTHVAPGRVDRAVDAVRLLRADLPDVGILLLAESVDERYATALLARGADGVGYLLDHHLSEICRLSDAIRHVGQGDSALDRDVITHMLGGAHDGRGALDALTGRDRDVLAQMALGASNHAIARRMFLSERAIERHVTAIFRTLELDASRHSHRRVLAVLAYLCAERPLLGDRNVAV